MHDLSTLPLGRRRTIAQRLMRGESVIANSLANEFSVSEDAIRRDLRALADEGVCKRVYGGALPLSPASTPMKRRAGEDVSRKRALAAAAIGLLKEKDTIFLDLGSTNLQLADLLPADYGLRVITNSVYVAASLAARSDISLFVIGGEVRPGIGGCVDARSVTEMRRFRIDLCFLGACALSLDKGLAGFQIADVDFKSALIEASTRSALLLTNSKIETGAPFQIGPVSDIAHLVVEKDAPLPFIDKLRARGMDVLVANEPAE